MARDGKGRRWLGTVLVVRKRRFLGPDEAITVYNWPPTCNARQNFHLCPSLEEPDAARNPSVSVPL
jgi:hypothetical protein